MERQVQVQTLKEKDKQKLWVREGVTEGEIREIQSQRGQMRSD